MKKDMTGKDGAEEGSSACVKGEHLEEMHRKMHEYKGVEPLVHVTWPDVRSGTLRLRVSARRLGTCQKGRRTNQRRG